MSDQNTVEEKVAPLDTLVPSASSYLARRFSKKPVLKTQAASRLRKFYLRRFVPLAKRKQLQAQKEKLAKSTSQVARVLRARAAAIQRMLKNKQISEAKAAQMQQEQKKRKAALDLAQRQRTERLSANALQIAKRNEQSQSAQKQIKKIDLKLQQGQITPQLALELVKKRLKDVIATPDVKQDILLEYQNRAQAEEISEQTRFRKQQQSKITRLQRKVEQDKLQKLRAKTLYKFNVEKAKKTLLQQQAILERAIAAKLISPDYAEKLRAKQMTVARESLAPLPKRILKVYPMPVTFTRKRKVICKKSMMPPKMIEKPQKTLIIIPILVAVKLTPERPWTRARRAKEITVVRKGLPEHTTVFEPRFMPRTEFYKQEQEVIPTPAPATDEEEKQIMIPEKPNLVNKFLTEFTTKEIPTKFW